MTVLDTCANAYDFGLAAMAPSLVRPGVFGGCGALGASGAYPAWSTDLQGASLGADSSGSQTPSEFGSDPLGTREAVS